MQTLSNVPFDQLRVGDRVKSKITNLEGVISSLYRYEKTVKYSDYEIFVRWEDGSYAYIWPNKFYNVWLM